MWDSGKVASARTFGIEYDGPPLTPRTRYHWTVRLWDGLDRAGEWAAPEWFETALLDEGFGEARWIGGATDSAPLLRRGFDGRRHSTASTACMRAASGTPTSGSTASASTDAVLDPGFTDYDHTVLYDDTRRHRPAAAGDNVVGAELGRGFFGLTSPNVWRWHQTPWTAEPRLIARLVIEYADGRTTEVVTDETWRITDGPTLSDSLYPGETYDARRALPGWDTPRLRRLGLVDSHAGRRTQGQAAAQAHEPIRVIENVEPVDDHRGPARRLGRRLRPHHGRLDQAHG